MSIKIGNGDRFIMLAWTDITKEEVGLTPSSREYFVQKDLHISIRDNHLYIMLNSRGNMKVKEGKIIPKKERLDELKKILKNKARAVEVLCIDIGDIELEKKREKQLKEYYKRKEKEGKDEKDK